jgi:cytochrome c biogenesis protein CcmG/thiol:disulfide interchange protein DsbE
MGGILYYIYVRRISFPIAVLSLLFLAGCYSGGQPPRIGKPAPDFVVQDVERKVTLSQFKGQVVVLNFWASWCPPCVAETPSLVRMHQLMKDKGVVVVAISADEDDSAYHRFISKYNMDFVTVRDPSAKIQHLYGTIQIPETYIIDRDGVLRRKFANAFDWNTPEVTDFLGKL